MTLAHALVYVIDDEMSMRKAIGRLLESEGYSVEMFRGAQEFLGRPPHGGPSCIVVDLNMPETNGLELQRALAESGRAEQVIFITGGASVPTCVQAMKAGAIDYLCKPFRDEDLLSAVEQALVRASEQWLKRLQRKEVRTRLATLTPREFEVLKLVIGGMLNKQIAARLGTTEGTIKVHPGRVMEKMGAALGWSWLFPPYRWHFSRNLSKSSAVRGRTLNIRRRISPDVGVIEEPRLRNDVKQCKLSAYASC